MGRGRDGGGREENGGRRRNGRGARIELRTPTLTQLVILAVKENGNSLTFNAKGKKKGEGKGRGSDITLCFFLYSKPKVR